MDKGETSSTLRRRSSSWKVVRLDELKHLYNVLFSFLESVHYECTATNGMLGFLFCKHQVQRRQLNCSDK